MIGTMLGEVTNHLWQSTLFALAVALLTLFFRTNRAQVRYWLWLSTSVKFLVPFALPLSLGSGLWNVLAARKLATEIATPAVYYTLGQITQPFPGELSLVPSAAHSSNWIPVAILGVWACGFCAVARLRWRGWLRIRAAVRASKPSDIPAAVAVRSSPGLLEPGVVGFLRPVLLLPDGIVKRLTSPQLEAVLAHELCHVRRRDNLTAALHMIVEAVFWFHPLVWWIGGRLVAERERACDEGVLSLGKEPRDYADAILSVCKLCAESPVACVSGVSRASLKNRIQRILSERVAGNLNLPKKIALTAAALGALAVPVVVGMISAPSLRSQSLVGRSEQVASGAEGDQTWRSLAFSSGTLPQAAGIAPRVSSKLGTRPAADTTPERVPAYLAALGAVTAYSVIVKPRVDGLLMSVSFKEGDLVRVGQVLASIDSGLYQARLAEAEGRLANDRAELAAAQGAGPSEHRPALAQLEGDIKIDQAKLDDAKLQLSYTQVTAPITGVVGLRQLDPGNIVHTTDPTGLVVINQLQPISVVFNLAEDYLPQVLPRLREGASLSVEAWSRDGAVKIATGHLVAVDNQIDKTVGAVKLKAAFDNKDGALFPNEFVNVRLLLNSR
jgi:RND family efflux transporter MFP subunit